MQQLAIKLIGIYQIFFSFDKGLLKFLAPGGACKYNPSCSAYTKQAIKKFGLGKGLILGTERILNCR